MTHKETSHTLGVEEATQLKSHEITVRVLRKRRVEEHRRFCIRSCPTAIPGFGVSHRWLPGMTSKRNIRESIN
jgi:hypothetical protein